MKTILLVALIALSIQLVSSQKNDFLEVYKNVTQAGNNRFVVTVGYKSLVGNGRLTQLKIFDSLPVGLEITSGKLVRKAEDPKDEWQTNVYTVEVAPEVEFTLENRFQDLTLPSTEFVFLKDGIAPYTLSSSTPQVRIELPIPKGFIPLSPVIAFFTLVLPVAAAYVLLGQYSATGKTKQK